jgi:hypothetical protein
MPLNESPMVADGRSYPGVVLALLLSLVVVVSLADANLPGPVWASGISDLSDDDPGLGLKDDASVPAPSVPPAAPNQHGLGLTLLDYSTKTSSASSTHLSPRAPPTP